MTAVAFILSMMVLIAATNVDSHEVSEKDSDRHTLSGIVVDADTDDGITNATVYIKMKNGNDAMQSDRTQQHQEGHAVEHDQDELDSTTTDRNGEFEFNNVDKLQTQTSEEGTQPQQTQQRDQNETFVLVVEAEGYETKHTEIKLSDYLDRDEEREEMDMDRDRDDDKDKNKDKVKIELTRSI